MKLLVLAWLMASLAIPAVAAPRAAPAAAPIESRDPAAKGGGLPEERYDAGDPSDEEQLMLEYINRARADAWAEAERLRTTTDPDVLAAYAYFGVDLDVMTNQFRELQRTVPPLAFNAALLRSAELHSLDMLQNNFQGHTSSTNPPPPNLPGDDPGDRMTRQDYPWTAYAENAFAYGENLWYSHAAFNVDWGDGAPYGMQSPPGHRRSIHTNLFREIGIGILASGTTNIGPWLMTQDFARRGTELPLLTGVAYYDLNTNQFYDVGEGLGGVEVTVAGATNWACTANSGAYAVPVPSNGVYAVTFTATNLAAWTTNLVVTNLQNAKADFMPVYSAPALQGRTDPIVGASNLYAVQALGGATAHVVRVGYCGAGAWTEGAETGTGQLQVVSNPSYEVLQTGLVYAGSRTFHLAHPSPPTDQSVTLLRDVYLQTNAVLQFASRLRTATNAQIARVEISVDDGASWTSVYAQVGSGSPGEGSFTVRQVSLSAWSGQVARVRFVYDFVSGLYYSGSNTLYGWFFDAVTVSNSFEVTNVVETTAGSSGAYALTPPGTGPVSLSIRGLHGRREFPWSVPRLLQPVYGSAQGTPASWFATVGLVTNETYPTWTDLDLSDDDEDGLTTGQEYVAGTHPTNPTSRLVIDSFAGTSLVFEAVSGKQYRTEWRTSLLAGAWMTGGLFTATGATAEIALPEAAPPTFYRVRVE